MFVTEDKSYKTNFKVNTIMILVYYHQRKQSLKQIYKYTNTVSWQNNGQQVSSKMAEYCNYYVTTTTRQS